MATSMRKVVVLKTIPSKSQGKASSGGKPYQSVKGIEITPAINTVAVTAAEGSGRERAAAFQPAWKIHLVVKSHLAVVDQIILQDIG